MYTHKCFQTRTQTICHKSGPIKLWLCCFVSLGSVLKMAVWMLSKPGLNKSFSFFILDQKNQTTSISIHNSLVSRGFVVDAWRQFSSSSQIVPRFLHFTAYSQNFYIRYNNYTPIMCMLIIWLNHLIHYFAVWQYEPWFITALKSYLH